MGTTKVYKRSLLMALTTLLLMLPFQNCSHPEPAQNPSLTAQSSSVRGGTPYDGKPFILPGACPDGTSVRSRLVHNGKTAVLYREDCQTIPPRQLSESEVTNLGGDEVVYGNQIFALERPAITLPGVLSWFVQLTGTLQQRPASIYIVDLFGNDAATIDRLKADGHTVICQISAGTVESWNPDAGNFAAADIGQRIQGSSTEKWIDTRSANVRTIMIARIDIAKSKGCQGIDFDAVDGFENNTGFPLTATTQIEYNQYLAFAAHDRSLIMTVNGVADLSASMAQIFDLAVAEQCFTYNECNQYQSFVNLGKPVLAIEYGPVSDQYCAEAKSSFISLAFFNRQLDGTQYDVCQ